MARTPEDLQRRLAEVIYFLHQSCMSYDTGVVAESLQLAVNLRKLLHKTQQSHPLLEQLNLLNSLAFYDTSSKLRGEGNEAGTTSLTVVAIGHGYQPRLDEMDHGERPTFADFREWWERVVVQEPSGFAFTRESIVLAAANQDGAHVDPDLHEAYGRLREQGVGWMTNGTPSVPVPYLVEATIRQVAHETLVSLAHSSHVVFPGEVPRRRYRYLPGPTRESVYGPTAGFGGIRINGLEDDGEPRVGPTANWPSRVGRNDPCPCGSGKKFKRCHGYG